MIKDLCYKLKEKRRELGYDIEEIVEKTKLHPSVIRDIEDCSLDKINTTYIKGFIKIYASFLKVEIGSNLDELTPQQPQTRRGKRASARDASRILSSIKQIKKKASPVLKKNLLLLVTVIISLWVLFSLSKFIITKIANLFKPKHKAEVTAKSENPIVFPEGTEELIVSVTAKDKCFLKAIVDGKLLFQGILNKGVVETWKADKELELRISDGSAVHLEVNGKSIPTLTSMHKPIKSLKVTSSGISVDK